MTRRCGKCRTTKSLEDFHRCNRDTQHGRQWTCIDCNGARNKAKYREIRDDLIELLGGRCACCDERRKVFLQIDHVHGGGGAERKALNSVQALSRRVRENPDAFQVLCANCHAAKTAGVKCPHKSEVGDLVWQAERI